jgi:hypothetical protein
MKDFISLLFDFSIDFVEITYDNFNNDQNTF